MGKMSSGEKHTCDYYYSILNTIQFSFSSGESIKLEPWDYTYNKFTTERGKSFYYCVADLKPGPYPLPAGEDNKIIFGTRFMKTFVTTLDFDTKQITLGKSVDAPVETFPETNSTLYLFLS